MNNQLSCEYNRFPVAPVAELRVVSRCYVHRAMKHIVFAAILLLVCGVNADEVLPGRGLEVPVPDRLSILVERLPAEAEKLNLTVERIEARVNQSLRKAGITPLDLKNSSGDDPYLYVNVNVTATAYAIDVSLDRRVYYRVANRNLSTTGATWKKGALGTHGGRRDPILDALGDIVDVFCDRFLKANGK